MDKVEKDKTKIKKTISRLMKRFTVIEINQEILNKALDSEVEDFEDAVIEISAIKNNVEYILTRNMKDFKKSKVSAKTPEEILALMY